MWHTVCMMGPRTISFNDNKSMMQFDKGPSIYYVNKGLRGWVKKVAFFLLTFSSIFADDIQVGG